MSLAKMGFGQHGTTELLSVYDIQKVLLTIHKQINIINQIVYNVR